LFFELAVELVVSVYIKLMTFLVPQKAINPRLRERVKKIVTAVSALLMLVMVIGALMWLAEEGTVIRQVGRYMVTGSALCIGVPMALGIVCKIVMKIHSKRKPKHQK
jgi:hypothetical protein